MSRRITTKKAKKSNGRAVPTATEDVEERQIPVGLFNLDDDPMVNIQLQGDDHQFDFVDPNPLAATQPITPPTQPLTPLGYDIDAEIAEVSTPIIPESTYGRQVRNGRTFFPMTICPCSPTRIIPKFVPCPSCGFVWDTYICPLPYDPMESLEDFDDDSDIDLEGVMNPVEVPKRRRFRKKMKDFNEEDFYSKFKGVSMAELPVLLRTFTLLVSYYRGLPNDQGKEVAWQMDKICSKLAHRIMNVPFVMQ